MLAPLPPAPDARPRLRRLIGRQRQGNQFVLHDVRRIGRPIGVTLLGVAIAERLDGARSLVDIQSELLALTGGALVPLESIQNFIRDLDEALLLDSPRIKSLFANPVRKPTHLRLDADKQALGDVFRALFTAQGGAGLPAGTASPRESASRLRAVLLPHMDYGRGNITYGHGFKELIENTTAKLFVVIATSHYSAGPRFTLTRQHFDTPFGLVETDVDYVNRIEALYGDGLFDDEEAHAPEHSIELELAPLRYFRGDAPFRIVPLLVGSFGDCTAEGRVPGDCEEIARMVRALREAEAAASEPVCYLISGDLAHIGPKFRDNRKAAGPWLVESRAKDQEILQSLGAADPSSYFNTIAEEQDARRICGLPPTWLTLEVARPRTGKVLHYQQFIDPTGFESVSFAAASFYA